MRSWDSMFKYAISKGANVQTAEEFAQEASLATHQGRKFKLEWFWVDFMRKHIAGRTNSPNYEQRLNVRNPIGSSSSMLEFEEPPVNYRITSRMSDFNMRERAVTVLSIKWGFTNEEIGHVLGLSPSRVSQIVNKIEADCKLRYPDC